MSDGKTKKSARRKRRKSFQGLVLVVRDGEAYIVARGIEQSEELGNKKVERLVEVGASRTVAFKISPSDAVHMACSLLLEADFHVKNCPHCNELVLQTVADLGAIEKSDEVPLH